MQIYQKKEKKLKMINEFELDEKRTIIENLGYWKRNYFISNYGMHGDDYEDYKNIDTSKLTAEAWEKSRIAWCKMLINGNAGKTTFYPHDHPNLFYSMLTNYSCFHEYLDYYKNTEPQNVNIDEFGNTFYHYFAEKYMEKDLSYDIILEFHLAKCNPFIKNAYNVSAWDNMNDELKKMYNTITKDKEGDGYEGYNSV